MRKNKRHMRRFAMLLFVCLGLAALAFGLVRNSPLAHSRFPFLISDDLTNNVLPDSLRCARYYDAGLSCTVDNMCVSKCHRELYVFHNRELQKIYRIALGDAPVGHKHFQGDEKTPEGLYFINGKNPNSCCHKNLGISYPNDVDRAYARSMGKSPGGDIKIHGLPNGQGHIGKAHLLHDWTNGCLGITDEEIDELYAHTAVGIPILILP